MDVPLLSMGLHKLSWRSIIPATELRRLIMELHDYRFRPLLALHASTFDRDGSTCYEHVQCPLKRKRPVGCETLSPPIATATKVDINV